ncbi:hypothetical protein [Agromyces soli]|uniref:Bacterial bifunctional deaminase-reductase C-terminal domain-containing protein n=1 Tax=Agromyces soli TaxID=659012 RepID=A0ABY4AW02_9MICO|nr:hypothetical protein [Agromyces soli]UOE27362.1 hypothetical protein MTP13_06155 [Agromyces soli]
MSRLTLEQIVSADGDAADERGGLDFVDSGLVDAQRLRVVPVLPGTGRSFAPDALAPQRLQLDHAVSFPAGHLGLTYPLAR